MHQRDSKCLLTLCNNKLQIQSIVITSLITLISCLLEVGVMKIRIIFFNLRCLFRDLKYFYTNLLTIFNESFLRTKNVCSIKVWLY